MFFLKALAAVALVYLLVAVAFRTMETTGTEHPWAWAFKWPILLLFGLFGNVR